MSNKHLSILASKLQGHARFRNFDGADGDLKRDLLAASHVLDSQSVEVYKKTDGEMIKDARGKVRFLTLRERLARWLLKGETEIRP